MPELPEVETTLRAIKSFEQDSVESIKVYNPNLRWKIDKNINKKIGGTKIRKIFRRAKYIIFDLNSYQLIVHLGMSGTLRIADIKDNFFKKHDHVELIFKKNKLIYNDPRRFGSIHVTESYDKHFLISKLGPEPLSKDFSKTYLYEKTRKSNTSIKNFIMNQSHVVGIGNIYASEILFKSSVDPRRKAKTISHIECEKITENSKIILQKAIQVGGTTLKDFYSAEGSAGYFKIQLSVYDREDQACVNCKNLITKIILNQRAAYFCNKCQS